MWLRRENTSFHNGLSPQELQSDGASDGVAEEQTGVSLRHFGAIESADAPPLAGSNPLPDAIAFLTSVWDDLPPHVRETIITLATSCKQARMAVDCDEGWCRRPEAIR